MPEVDWLPEQIKTCICLCQTVQILIGLGRKDLLPTQLEYLHELTQQIIEENCISEK